MSKLQAANLFYVLSVGLVLAVLGLFAVFLVSHVPHPKTRSLFVDCAQPVNKYALFKPCKTVGGR